MLPDVRRADPDFWDLWENDRPLFFSKCLKLMNGDVSEAEDALSAAMLKAWDRMIRYRDSIQNFKGWALRLTENVCLDLLRRHRRLISYGEIPEHLVHGEHDRGHLFLESTEQYHSREVLIEGIFESVRVLPRRLREPALLRFLFFASYRDIASHLHIKEENARKRVQEVRAELKSKYGGTMADLLESFSGEGWMEAESLAMKRIRGEARSMLDGRGDELELCRAGAWIVDALPVCGRTGEILVFLAATPDRYRNGFEPFMNYLSRHPGGWKRLLELAQFLYAAGLWREAEDVFLRVLTRHPGSFSARIFLGNLLLESGRTGEAEGVFRQAGALAQRESSREYLAGMSAVCRGDGERAIRSFERAGALEPSNVSFRQAIGISRFRSGRYETAQGIFREILAESPGDIVSLAYCCETALRLNRPKDAGRYVDGILAVNPDDFYGLKRKVGLGGDRGARETEAWARLRRITVRFDQLAMLLRSEREKIHGTAVSNVYQSKHGSEGRW